MDLEQLERYRRVTFASLFFTYPGVAQGVVNKALACIPSSCTALV